MVDCRGYAVVTVRSGSLAERFGTYQLDEHMLFDRDLARAVANSANIANACSDYFTGSVFVALPVPATF